MGITAANSGRFVVVADAHAESSIGKLAQVIHESCTLPEKGFQLAAAIYLRLVNAGWLPPKDDKVVIVENLE